jgi:pyruvate/2-oxoacid:ferredoxin oxidoreductase alpha subunit
MKRRTLIGGVAAASAGIAAGLYRFTDLFVKHYPPTPYDDVLAKLTDRGEAAKLGAHVATPDNAAQLAARLRQTVPGRAQTAAEADIGASRMTEADGWLLPQTVALLAALAARA